MLKESFFQKRMENVSEMIVLAFMVNYPLFENYFFKRCENRPKIGVLLKNYLQSYIKKFARSAYRRAEHFLQSVDFSSLCRSGCA